MSCYEDAARRKRIFSNAKRFELNTISPTDNWSAEHIFYDIQTQ